MAARNVPLRLRGLASLAASRGAPFAHVPQGPPDAILGVTEAFRRDSAAGKINLGVGAYRDAGGRPYVLPSVRAAEKRIAERGDDMEYLPVGGLRSFVEKAQGLAFGGVGEGVAGVQALSGTGACRLGGELVKRFGGGIVMVPQPTWSNHHAIFRDAGCEVRPYGYYDAGRRAVDVGLSVRDLKEAPEGAAVLLHATAHNPTGCDPSAEEWGALSEVIAERGLVAFFDSAYQGFTSGDADKDAAAIRMFVDQGHRVLLAQSFSKNMGLYGHRVGAFSVVTDSKKEADAVESQLKIVARAMWSNPPIAGVKIVDEVLGDPQLEPMWREEMRGMAGRIIAMRAMLREELEKCGSQVDWAHIVNQNGMFTFSGLSEDAVKTLAAEHSVYLTANGRISMAGVYENNVGYLARAMHAVSKDGL